MKKIKIEIITKYQQIVELIEQKIKSSEYLPGTKLPSERELAKIYNVSHMTVNKALACLVEKGILKRVHGNGTYIVGKKHFISTKLVAIVIRADIENHPIFYPLLPNILQENGYFPFILDTQSQGVIEKLKNLIIQSPKALIIEPTKPDLFSISSEYKEYENVIFIHIPPPRKINNVSKFSFIYCDYELAGYIGIETLLKNNRKNILVLSYEREPENISDWFLSGCEKASKDYGCCLYYVDTNKMNENDYKKLFYEKRFDGTLSLGDFRLIPVLKVLQEISVRVPEDVQLIGTYNTPWAQVYDITSISINQREIVNEAVECLKRGEKGYIKKINPYLTFRKSCPE